MKKLIVILLLVKCFNVSGNNSVLRLNLREAVELAQTQSPDIWFARHNFRASYWGYVSYRANFLPSLTFNSRPNFNRMINPITLSDGTVEFAQQNLLMSDATFMINQNIPFTGGTLFVASGLQRLDLFHNNTHQYRSTPLIVGYRQELFGFNALRWDRKIEPLRFEEAKRRYVENLELVGARAVRMFFGLAKAQTNLEIAQTNYANADTLYVFARGRYNIGTITENEMLQLRINKLMEEGRQLEAQMQLDDAMENLRAFLGIREMLPIEVEVESHIPLTHIDVSRALKYAADNAVDMLTMQRQQIESEGNVAHAQAIARLRVDLFMQFGLAQMGQTIEAAYRNPLDQQFVELGIRLPILDWGRGRGQIEVARSNRDMIHAQVAQQQVDFEMNVVRLVNQFNLQSHQLNVAAQVNDTAERRSEVARRLFLLGRSSILDLNASITERDAALRNYINTLHTYWSLYYMLRSITLFDFVQDIPITEDYRLLIR